MLISANVLESAIDNDIVNRIGALIQFGQAPRVLC